MKKPILKAAFLVLFLIFLSLPALGIGLSPEQRKNIESMVLESKSNWDSNQKENNYTESDILIELGVDAYAKDGNQFEGDDIFNQSLSESSTNGFMLRRQGSEKLLCKAGAAAQLANLEVRVLECKDGRYQVAMCDATSFGHNCSEHNTHTDSLDISGSKQVFKYGVFNGAYQLESTCSVAACDIRYKAVYQQEFSTVSVGSKSQGDQAAISHSVDGSIFNDVSSIYTPTNPSLAKVRKDLQDNKSEYIDCYTERMSELNDSGEVRQSCDPKDARTFNFETEKGAAEAAKLELPEAPDNSAALAKVIAEGERAKALSSAFAGNMSEDSDGNITIFNGNLHQCNKYSSKFFDYMYWPINLPFYTVFETFLGGLDRDKRNCCVGLPENISTTVNAGNCDQEDIKLAAKRLASAAHLIELDGAMPVDSGNTSSSADFQDASVAYGKKCYAIGVDRVCTLRDDDEFETCLSYAIDVSVNVPDYSLNERWNDDSDLARKGAALSKLAVDNHYFVEASKYGIPSRVCQHVLFDSSCGSGGCDRVIKTETTENGQVKDYFDTEKCACEQIAADGSCAKMPATCRVYPNEEDVDLVGVDDVVTDGHWLPGRFEACAFWSRYTTPLFGLIMRPGNRGNQDASNELHKLALKPHVCKEYMWDVVDRLPIDHYQSWCAFDDPFARIIQEQGRKQLALYATRPETGSVSDVVDFGFYTPIVGSWTQAKIVNKQDVRFWQWPHSCTDTATVTRANITDQSCPKNADIYIAICSSEGTCGSLPTNPVLQASGKWDIRLLRGENTELHALTPLLVIQGNCTNNGLCKYNLHAWQKSVSGSIDVPIDMNWALKGVNGGWKINYNSHNQIHLMAYTEPLVLDTGDIFDFEIGQNKLTGRMPPPKLKMCLGSPSACKIDSFNDDVLWKTINLDSPTIISGQVINDPRLTGGIRVKAFGQCSPETLNCAYRIVANIKLEAKPWHRGVTYDTFKARIKPKVFGKYIGGKKTQHYNHKLKADCSGFTLDQFLALNLTAMDLREFTDIIAKDVEHKIQKITADININDDADKIIRGESTTMISTGTKNFRLYPDNGYPGEETQLQPLYTDKENRIALTKNGITITHKVLSYTVDWEGRPHTIMTYSPSQSPTYKYGDLELQSIGETIVGSIIWHTDAGDISESFTYKIWFNPNESGGGGKIGAGTVPGTTSATESLDSPIKQFNELDEDLRKLDPQNW